MKKVSIRSLTSAVIVCVIGMLMTYILSIKVGEQLKKQSYLKVENIAKQVSINVQNAINISLNDLQGLQAFYSVNQELYSLNKFNQYMHVLDIENRDYIQVLSWVPLVKDIEREKFESVIRNQQENFTITERNSDGQLITSQIKEYYTPVTFISPFEKNKLAQGYDLTSNTVRRNSLEFARDNGTMTTTEQIRLVQETGHSVGFLIIAPVYKQEVTLTSVQDRFNALKGYVTGVFRIDTLMLAAKEQADKEGLVLTLLDINQDNSSLLFGEINSAPFVYFDLDIPERQWRLNISLKESLLNSIESPVVVKWFLLGGFLVSFLMALSIFALQTSIIRSRNIKTLSQELQNQNDKLESKVLERTELLENKNHELNETIAELKVKRVVMSGLIKESISAKRSAEKRALDLSRSNKDLDDFAYIASHDLQAPLRAIDQLAQWVTEDIAEGNLEEVPEHLKLMCSRVRRLETLLNDLLAYSRINRQQYKLGEIDVAKVVHDLVEINAPIDNFTLTIKGVLPIFVTANLPLEQVFNHLISNAIKHHHQGEGRIQICCEEDNDFYHFFVKDDGPGIKLDYHSNIFQMFRTLKPRDETEGSGMGLALVKKIVQRFSGDTSLESTVGEGCTFSFTWPKTITTLNE
ncbi:CHASE domain-containing protein [Pseudocolwellia sp. AS88]|uniref:sensor histidine kinase n=1 Tax=Pseudocolwellia sp. AS88 TaxID=3063958 RepID=UPI0026EE29E1|nr:CHASE domain-containing protein [Pseudocolwellia sp. AS88]MDO7083303.1 CHASE domain-containing protein [Pseudocolwellia sp. AS88]